MRIALLGAAASALLGGTLAVTPLTSVSTPIPTSGTCSIGGKCERAASVLMPETPKPAPDAAQPGPFNDVANVTPPGGPAAPGDAAAAGATPGAGMGPGCVGGSGGGAPAAAGDGATLPALPDVGVPDPGALGLLDPNSVLPGLAGV